MQTSTSARRSEFTIEASRKVEPIHQDLLVAILLFAAQAACFLPACFNVGFYLDDWLTFWNLHFAAHNFPDLLKASFSDPRMVTRPVQCLYYATTYFFFGDRPLPYHLLSFSLEYLGALALYFGLKRLSLSPFLAALSSLIFLLYPNHDATHYWIGAALGPGFGLTLFLLSFAFSVKAFETRKRLDYILAVAFYGLSVFCYESYLPMLVMSVCAILLLSAEYRMDSRLNTIGSVLLWFLPFVIIGAAEPLYQRLLLPRIAHTFLSPAAFDPVYSLNVFVQGLNVSLFAGLWSFLAQRVRESFINFNLFSAMQVVVVIICSSGIILSTFVNKERIRYRRLYTAAILTFFASYLTFACAQGYTPVLDTMINRINIGASVAVSILLALSARWLLDHMQVTGKTARISANLILIPLLAIMVLANLSLSSFWACSWQVQKNIRWLVSQHAAKLKDGDCLILADTHRYLMWAPVFDGTWDFQSMLRMTLNNNKISGGVVSDRLTLKSSELQDVSAGYLCASYPAERLTVLFPSEARFDQVKNATAFVDLVQAKSASIPVSASTIARWRREIQESSK